MKAKTWRAIKEATEAMQPEYRATFEPSNEVEDIDYIDVTDQEGDMETREAMDPHEAITEGLRLIKNGLNGGG